MRRLLPILAIALLAFVYRPALSRPGLGAVSKGEPRSTCFDTVAVVSSGNSRTSKGDLLSTYGVTSPAESRADHTRVRHEIQQIMASPDYNRTHNPNLIERLQARVGKWIRDALTAIFGWIGDHLSLGDLSGAGILATVGTWAVVIAFAGLLGLIAWRYARSARGDAPPGEDEVVSYELPSAKPLMKQAAKLAEAGDYRGAFRAAYLASIAYLDSIRALRFERSRTNWEYMRELKRGGHEMPHSELHPITLDFDRKIYGRESCGRQDYVNAAAVYERLSREDAK